MTRQKAFLILQSALCILTAILLAAAAVMIFREGSAYKAAGHPAAWIYTREKAAARLVPILPLFAVSVIMTVIGWIKGISDETIGKPVQDAELARNLMCAKIKDPSDEMKKERDLQKKLQVGGRAVFAACMIPILLYITNAGHFDRADVEGLDQVILSLVLFVVPWTAVGLAALSIAGILQEKSMEREMKAAAACLKQAGSAAPGVTPDPSPAVPLLNHTAAGTAERSALIRRILLAASIILIVLGICNGSMTDVLIKAVKICTECVGLG